MYRHRTQDRNLEPKLPTHNQPTPTEDNINPSHIMARQTEEGYEWDPVLRALIGDEVDEAEHLFASDTPLTDAHEQIQTDAWLCDQGNTLDAIFA